MLHPNTPWGIIQMVMKMICDQTIKNRIKRAKGQMQGIIDMMDKDHACMDIVTQLKAVRSSIDKSIGILTTENLKQILVETKDLDNAQVEEAIKIIIKGI